MFLRSGSLRQGVRGGRKGLISNTSSSVELPLTSKSGSPRWTPNVPLQHLRTRLVEPPVSISRVHWLSICKVDGWNFSSATLTDFLSNHDVITFGWREKVGGRHVDKLYRTSPGLSCTDRSLTNYVRTVGRPKNLTRWPKQCVFELHQRLRRIFCRRLCLRNVNFHRNFYIYITGKAFTTSSYDALRPCLEILLLRLQFGSPIALRSFHTGNCVKTWLTGLQMSAYPIWIVTTNDLQLSNRGHIYMY